MESLYHGFKSIDELIFKVNKKIIGKRGVHYQKLLKDWPKIVGENIANLTIPIKILIAKTKQKQENVLYIAASNSSIGIEVAYYVGIIKEQINMYFGYDYIQQIKIMQAIFSNTIVVKPIEIKLNEEQLSKAFKLVDLYQENDEIRDALLSIAKRISAKN